MNKSSPDQTRKHWLDSWHVDPSSNREYDFIDGLRGLAILMVITSHAIYAREPHSFAAKYLLHFMGTFAKGVNLFFTLSGFLISWPFWRRKGSGAETLTPRGYGWRRFWKIYPPLALSVLLLTPCFIAVTGNMSVFLRTAFEWLTGLAFLVPVNGKLNPVMWSLVVEIHFYVVLPLLFLFTKRLSAKACLGFIPPFLFVVPVCIEIVTGKATTFTPQIQDMFCTGLSSFCFGVAVAGIDALKIWNKSWAKIGDAGWIVMFFGMAGLGWVQMHPPAQQGVLLDLFHWTILLGTGCLLCYAAAPENPRAQLLCAPWLRWFGIISYEWYLFHQPMLGWSRELFGPTNGNVIKYAFVLGMPLAVSLTVAALIYRHFSLPILKFGRSRNAARKAKP